APSANLSAQLSPTTAAHVLRDLGGRIEMVLDAGPTPAGLESTVLDLTSHPPRVLRPGPITSAEIEAVIGVVTQPATVPSADLPLPPPGMMTPHYAPPAPLDPLP